MITLDDLLAEVARNERAQRRSAAMKQRRTSARGADPSIGRTRPAWQRYAGFRGVETAADRAARTRRGTLLPQRMRGTRLAAHQRQREQARREGLGLSVRTPS